MKRWLPRTGRLRIFPHLRMQPTLRPFAATDSAAAHALWQATEGMGLNAADSAANLAEFLDRNPGLSVVAEQDGKLIGTALCGHDGRRGFIHHLAVTAVRSRMQQCVAL